MGLTKKTVVDRIETRSKSGQGFFYLQVREKNQILEDGKEISSSFHRSIIYPDHDVSKITDLTVLTQFNAVMTDEVKASYNKVLEDQRPE